MRMIPGLFLSLTLILSGLASASARGSMAGSLEMIVCTGKGMVQLTIGADGNPVDTREICPDCTLVLAAPLPAGIAVESPERTGLPMAWDRVLPLDAKPVRLRPLARGPPRLG